MNRDYIPIDAITFLFLFLTAITFLIQLGYTTDFDPTQSYVWNGEQEE